MAGLLIRLIAPNFAVQFALTGVPSFISSAISILVGSSVQARTAETRPTDEEDLGAGFDAAGVAKIGSIGDDVAPPLFGSVLI
jgi:hypothetical protein